MLPTKQNLRRLPVVLTQAHASKTPGNLVNGI